ncbi:odorant receptor 4 [Camponotus floridanus]|uniref:odorant receptor 4 n=1 Tax=Camponotus floridanus TaxID=104421 RepID=UPI0009716C0D|nr:odorant receptor 4 [Camponotus floridanus]
MSKNEQDIMIPQNILNRKVKFIFTLCGIWPGISCVLFYRMFWIITMTIAISYLLSYLLAHLYTAELMDLIDCLCLMLAHIKVISKCFIFWLNQKSLIEILTLMAEDWDDCTDNDISMRETSKKAKLSDRLVNAIFILHTTTVSAYCIGLFLSDMDITDQMIELPFIGKLKVPFHINTQRVYKLTIVAQSLHMILCGWVAGITNVLLLTLTLHTASQIDILRYWITQLTSCESKLIVITIKKIIQKHQKIVTFSENIECLYTYIALVQFVSNTVMICSLGFLIVTAIGNPNAMEQIMKSLLFYTITNLEAFIFCFAGEYMSNKSKEIGVAAYNSTWYDLKSKDSRVLLFVMLRSQKQLTLTAGKMMDLSLESFKNIMSASGSYLSMLLAMQ